MAERREWLYYRVPVGSDGAGDPLLRSVVGPVVRRLRTEVPDLRWFYLRFLDSTGLHVRWRLNAAAPVLNHVERLVDDALTTAAHDGTCGGHTKHVYDPEIGKFGADLGVAEQLFQLSSETMLGLLATYRRPTRSGLAAALMLTLVQGLPPEQRPGFLHQYGWYWSGGPARRSWTPAPWTSLADPRVRARAVSLLEETQAVLAGPSGELVRGFAREFWAKAGEAKARTNYFQLFHHLHLADNRIGVFPAAEAALARLLFLSACDLRMRAMTLVM
ncbi:MAG: hypothetical protein JWQ81_780 [Amycolatopsis sp.]|jgi:hypothetical protein|uniref:thiopeptide-type bacteriocin biosynthesis protein n=1 Tax=Amycolatopsis sp. TaxID=37632 RepID=UPI00262D3837|nr:thiopeptide-type bacteriocin biosynthesis protein [Amycolatopsis sp.]MCU1680041.1 hypothetical protein [Amycolatopsis sp.]